MTRFVKAGLFATASLSAVAFAAPPVLAQDSDEPAQAFEIEEIVVTARRRSESLTSVPGTVSAVTQTTITNAGVERADDFIALVPGVTLVNAAEVGDTQVNIRGINGARDAENSFAFVIDGVLYTNPAAFNREYARLQQIEVFKGPQGAIYGRNAAAGAIIVTTAKPGDELGGRARVSIAEDDTYFGQATLDGPLIDNELWFSVAADWRDTDGFYRNQFKDNAPTVDRFENWNLNGRLIWEPSPEVSLDTKVRYGEVDAASITFNAAFALPNFAAAFGNPAAYEDVNERDFVFQQNIDHDNDQTAFEISSKLDADYDWGSLTAWVLYSDIENNLLADGTSAGFGFFNGNQACQDSTAALNAQGVTLPDPQILGTTPVPIIFTPDFSGSFFGPYTPTTCDGLQEQIRNQEDISFELRIASPDDADVRWMAGVYALDINRQVGVSLGQDNGAEPIRGLVQLDGPNRTEALVFDDFDSQVFAVFGSLDYDVTEDIELSAALRYDREKRSVSSLVPTEVDSTVIDLNGDGIFNDPLNPGLSDAINPSGVIPDQQRTFKEFQPKVSATWDVDDSTTLFASWGVGFKAGGFNNSGSAATIDLFINNSIDPFRGGLPLVNISDTYDKETSSAFEAGFKSRFGRFSIEGAGYYTQVDDMQFFEFFVGTFGLLRVVSNVDKVDIYGLELSANAQITDWLSAYAGVNVTDSEIKANSARPDTVGNKSPYTADYTINYGAEIDYPITDDFNLLVRADAQIIGPTWFHTVQNQDRPTIFQGLFEIAPVTGPGSAPLGLSNWERTRRDSYMTVDLRAGIQAEGWSLIAFANNVTNEKYLEEVIPAVEFGGAFVHPGTLRRIGVELNLSF